MRDTLKPCVSTLNTVTWGSLQNPLHKPQAPATKHRVTGPAQRFASNQIFYFPCQAAAISHFSSDLDGSNVGIHYHTRTLLRLRSVLSSALSTVMDLQCMPPGPLKQPCLVCAAPAPGSSSAFSPVHRCQKTFS